MVTAYVNGQVIDGRGQGIPRLCHRRWRQDRGGRAEAIRLSLGEAIARKDLASKSILPGLIDCHVHLRNDGVGRSPRTGRPADTDAVAVLRSARNARRTLEAGVTTIRDCGSRGGIDFSLRAAAQQGLCPTPRLVLSGMMICMTGGHGWTLGLRG